MFNECAKLRNQMHYFLLKIGIGLPISHAVIKCLVALPVENALPPRFVSRLDRLHGHCKYLAEQIAARPGYRPACQPSSAHAGTAASNVAARAPASTLVRQGGRLQPAKTNSWRDSLPCQPDQPFAIFIQTSTGLSLGLLKLNVVKRHYGYNAELIEASPLQGKKLRKRGDYKIFMRAISQLM